MKYITLAFLLVATNICFADWHLDSKNSTISFVSVKKGTAVETHQFTKVSGTVSESGSMKLAIDLNSADTQIPIRDERLASMLFETGLYPRANISAKLNLDSLKAMQNGESKLLSQVVELDLHGIKVNLEVDIHVIRISSNSLSVNSHKPVILDASQFGLSKGIDALRDIAGLSAITASVPVYFNLIFSR